MSLKNEGEFSKNLLISPSFLHIGDLKIQYMITFGYKGRFSGAARAVIALIFGAVMFFTGNSVTIIVQILAAFVLASGVMSLILGLKREDQSQRPLIMTNSGLNIVIAVLMFLFADSLGGLIVGIIGIILILFGLFQLVVLFSANRVLPVGAVGFIMPVAVLACGFLLLFKPKFVDDVLGYVVGASLMIYGISELISSRKMRKSMEVDGAKDVDFEKVDKQ